MLKALIIAFVYLIITVVSLLLFRRAKKKSIIDDYKAESGGYIFSSIFWPLSFMFMIAKFIYYIPTNIVTRVESRQDKYKERRE